MSHFHWNPIQIQRYLGGLEYPTNKQKIIEHAREQGAPETVLEALSSSSQEEYQTPADLIQGGGETT